MNFLRLLISVSVLSLFAPAALRALELGKAVGPVKLTTLTGEPLVMNNYSERPGTAVLFVSARCLATDAALAEINKLHAKYRLRNLLFVGVCSNEAESGEELRTFSQRRGLIFPVERDPSGEVARQFGATATPELFLLDRGGTLVFHGGVANEAGRKAADAAMASLMAKKPIATPTSPVEGTPIDRPGPPREIDDLYGTVWHSAELVFETIPAAAHHCSVICQAANGDLLCLWYGGTYESADDQTLFLARRPAGERVWNEPQALLQNAAQPPGNGIIFRGRDETLWIIWARMEGTRPMRRGSGWGHCRLMIRSSADHGATWSDDTPVFEHDAWNVPRNPPITLTDGTMLLGVEGMEDKADGSDFLALAPGESRWKKIGFTPGGSQPAIVERSDGSVLALLRHGGHIQQIESRDGGRSWTKAIDTPLKNPDAGISMARLANGHFVLVFNDSQTDRTPLSIVRSQDEGKTWEKPLHLESNPGEYSYPSVIQTADGRIHVTYTFRRYAIKHVELSESWLDHFERSD
jgi:predicted neuraminidase/peroxiredoxin